MGYYVKTVVGAALFLGCITAFNIGLVNLMEIGTCASGGPYVSARPCPEGTGGKMALLFGGIIGGLIGAAIFAFRGDRPGGSGESLAGGFFGWGTFAWGLFFAGTGTVALVSSLTMEDDGTDGKLGGLIVAGTFLTMGLPVFLFSLKGILTNLVSGRRGGGSRGKEMSMGDAANAAAAAAASSSSPGGAGSSPGWAPPAAAPAPASRDSEVDELDQLARLDQLRKSGALSQTEFDREKAKILGR
jgi:hypothetical protein